MSHSISRREFALSCGRTAALVAGSSTLAASLRPAVAAGAREGRHTICAFTKPFQSLSYDELAERMAALGFDGVEATVRDGGHIEPAQVEDELPKLAEALKKRGVEITILASSIGGADEPHTEKYLRTAAALGIRRYRMEHLRYDPGRPVMEQIDALRPRFRDLAAMNREVGISAVYQNHAGANYVGGPIWDLHFILRGIPVEEIGVAFDIRHATVEGGTTWGTDFSLIRPHIGAVYVKDFRWDDKKVKNVPLGEGLVSPRFFTLLARSGYDGPISLHEEYLDHRDPKMVEQHVAAFRKDLKVLRAWLRSA